jgi:predicted RNA-binding Zn ribbon-like protein
MVLTGVEEDVWRREQAAPQPGQRPAAPGALAVLQAFLNSHFDLVENWGGDLLGTPGTLRAWFVERRLIAGNVRLTAVDVDRAMAVREGLRQLIASGAGTTAALEPRARRGLSEAIAGASLELRLAEAGMRLVPVGDHPLDRGLGVLLSVAASAMLQGGWSRLKACPGDHCGWVFYDLSRNNSGRWCSMTVCGGREKSRAHYRRRRTRGD